MERLRDQVRDVHERPYKENPIESGCLPELLKKHEAALSIGNGMRAGAVHDSTDRARIQELIIKLSDKAHSSGVQTIVKGPGRIPNRG